ncbi:hypothetical protein Vadar_020908 [Vaccinium darrowii]|uniref:Uncharacterized protein n=1 Tax=Vaccinium darrowii TaxID=229202 RepID=A0ACB7X351_9ERIC|nr:hypothetical protein Vadar_020908 [Vaccinium darrowii]
MRLDRADSGNANFAKFLTEIGTSPEETVNLPSTIRKCRDLNELLSTVYPQLDVIDASTPAFLTERTILSGRNDDVNAINAAALNIFPGEAFTTIIFSVRSLHFTSDDELRSRQIEVSEGGITPAIVEIEGSDANLFVFQTLGEGARLYGSGAGYGRRHQMKKFSSSRPSLIPGNAKGVKVEPSLKGGKKQRAMNGTAKKLKEEGVKGDENESTDNHKLPLRPFLSVDYIEQFSWLTFIVQEAVPLEKRNK